jgi:hypothetical protein
LSAPSDLAEVPPDDRSVQGDGPRSAKQNAKRVEADPLLTQVIDAWPGLPEAAKTVILATVEAYTNCEGR